MTVIARALFPRLPCLHLTQAQGDPSLSDSVVRPVAAAMRETMLNSCSGSTCST
ncbi:MAG: hypothetical protein KKC71_02745 [Chloroflexi bacterium]|nr:hypothetical protein [Chloroflexota bacterium]